MSRKLDVSIASILELISCAEDYGFESDVLFDSFSAMLDNTITDEEIENYARSVEAEEGYGEEDYIGIKEKLNDYKCTYCLKE